MNIKPLRDKIIVKPAQRFTSELLDLSQMQGVDTFTRQAMGLLTSSKLAEALDLSKEDPRLAARYGRGDEVKRVAERFAPVPVKTLSRRDKKNDTDQWAYTSGTPGNAAYWGAGSTAMSAFTNGLLDFSLIQASGRLEVAGQFSRLALSQNTNFAPAFSRMR